MIFLCLSKSACDSETLLKAYLAALSSTWLALKVKDSWYILTRPNIKANNFINPLFCIVMYFIQFKNEQIYDLTNKLATEMNHF
jgi:hypothetical protein